MVFGVAASSSPARRPFTGPNSPPAQSRTVSGRGSIYEGAQLRGPLEDMSTPVLYTHVLCPYAQRAWLALLEKVGSGTTALGLRQAAANGVQAG